MLKKVLKLFAANGQIRNSGFKLLKNRMLSIYAVKARGHSSKFFLSHWEGAKSHKLQYTERK